jgi:hypothetical protein
LPKAALSAVLIVAAIGLFDVAELLRIWKIDRWEFAVSIITTLGVVALDILNGILMAVLIAIHLLLMRVSRPPDAVLGRVSGLKGFHNIIHHEQARTWADLVLYRFGAALVFSMRRISRSACWRWLPPTPRFAPCWSVPEVQAALGDGSLFRTLKSAVDACASGGFAQTSEAGTKPS